MQLVQLPYHDIFSSPSLAEDTDNVNKMFKQNEVKEAERADSVRKIPTNYEVDALVFGSSVGIVRPSMIENIARIPCAGRGCFILKTSSSTIGRLAIFSNVVRENARGIFCWHPICGRKCTESAPLYVSTDCRSSCQNT